MTGLLSSMLRLYKKKQLYTEYFFYVGASPLDKTQLKQEVIRNFRSHATVGAESGFCLEECRSLIETKHRKCNGLKHEINVDVAC